MGRRPQGVEAPPRRRLPAMGAGARRRGEAPPRGECAPLEGRDLKARGRPPGRRAPPRREGASNGGEGKAAIPRGASPPSLNIFRRFFVLLG